MSLGDPFAYGFLTDPVLAVKDLMDDAPMRAIEVLVEDSSGTVDDPKA